MLLNLNQREIQFLLYALEHTSIALADKLYAASKPREEEKPVEVKAHAVRLTKAGLPAKKPGPKPKKAKQAKSLTVVAA